jgi:hypothetical protein
MSDLDPSKGTGSGRYIFWNISLNHILNRSIDALILGEGMGSYRDVIYRHFGLYIGGHTDWLDIPFAFGIFGFVVMMFWYLELIRFANYLRVAKNPASKGVFSAIVIFFITSIGQGGFYDPSFAMIYAALGFWAGQVSYYGKQISYAGCASY